MGTLIKDFSTGSLPSFSVKLSRNTRKFPLATLDITAWSDSLSSIPSLALITLLLCFPKRPHCGENHVDSGNTSERRAHTRLARRDLTTPRAHKVINKRAAILVLYSAALAFLNFRKVKRNRGNGGYLFPSRTTPPAESRRAAAGIAAVYYLQRKPSHVRNNAS